MRTAEQVQDEISALLKRLADPVVAGESVKALIRRAATRSGLTYGQTKRLWYHEVREVPAHVADNIRERTAAHERKLKHAAYQALVEMQKCDPEFFSDSVEALGEVLLPVGAGRRAAGGKD